MGSELAGILIALCCHHRCDWGPYVGKKFLEEQGFSEADFQLLSSITSWCTCGSGRPRLRQDTPLPPELHSPEPHSPPEESQLPPAQTGEAGNADNMDRYTRLNWIKQPGRRLEDKPRESLIG